MQSMTRFRRFTAAAALAALAASGTAVAVSTTAFADEAAATATPTAAPTFPAGTTGSLTIHKHKTPASGATASTGGLEAKDAPNDPIEGVQFTIKKIEGIDLSTNDGWAAAEKLAKADLGTITNKTESVSDGTTSYSLATVTDGTKATEKTGVTTFSGLDLGLYLVLETDTSGAKIGGEAVKVKAAAPFFVTIPLTNPENHNQWMTDIHVYPKNTPTNDIISKSVQDAGDQLGDDVSFTVDTGIDGTDAKAASGITQYIIKDPLVKYLTGKADTAVVKLINGTDGSDLTDQQWKLEKGTDYTVELGAAEDVDHSGVLTVTFQDSGLKKLTAAKKANENAKVRLTFDATVTSLPGDGTVTNQAYVFPNGVDSSSLSNGEPSNTTESKWGKIEFVKKNSAEQPLDGAKFILTNCNDKTPIAVNGVTEFASAKDTGKVTISGIHVSDFVDGVAVSENKVKYCLDEIEAPNGYELLPGHAAEFYVNPLTTDEGAAASFDAAVAQNGGNIVNYPKNGGFNLPLTGAQGLATAGIAGALLVAGGYVLVVRRRREEEAA